MKYRYRSKNFNPNRSIELPDGVLILSTEYHLDCNNHEYQKVGHDVLGISFLEPE